MGWSLNEVWEALTGEPVSTEAAGRSLDPVVVDSRASREGSLFVALRGEREDGHEFVADAFQRGAGAAIVEQSVEGCGQVVRARAGGIPEEWPEGHFCIQVENTLAALEALGRYRRSQFNPRIIAVTGSTGKTMTKELIAAVLDQSFETLKSPASYNDEIGLPLTLSRMQGAHQRVVLEMGMYALGEIAQLSDLAQPQIGVVTNVGHSHFERLGSLEQTAQAKQELVEALPPDGAAVLNADDPRVEAMASASRAPVVRFGLGGVCDVRASEIDSRGLEGVRFRLHHGSHDLFLRIPLLGRHSVHTALAAAAVGMVEGEPWERIVEGLQTVPEQLRLIALPGIKDSTIIDDTYNANPTSTLAALNLLEELEGRRVAVLGDMLELGAYQERGHRLVGHRAAEVVARLVTVGPRARIIAEGARAAGLEHGAILEVDDNALAVDALGQLVAPGDIILVKGSRAMRMEEIVEKLTSTNSGGPWPPR